MAINTRTEYAIRALLEIMESGNEPVSTTDICKRQSLPKKYVEHLLSGMRSAGIIQSTAGSKGGYLLATEPDSIYLYSIMQAVDDTAWELSCNMKGNRYCIGQECGLQAVWSQISNQLQDLLKSYTLQTIFDLQNEKGAK